MIPAVDFSSLRNAHWWQFAVRFVLGGAVTACTGLVAQHWGPVVGGLFLSFPAIFPASATLIARHETDKNLKPGSTIVLAGARLLPSMRRCRVRGMGPRVFRICGVADITPTSDRAGAGARRHRVGDRFEFALVAASTSLTSRPAGAFVFS